MNVPAPIADTMDYVRGPPMPTPDMNMWTTHHATLLPEVEEEEPREEAPDWAVLYIGECTLYVYVGGAVRRKGDAFNMVDYGLPYAGTPWRTVHVQVAKDESRRYFVHELVWRAFMGDVLDGYEVGHTREALEAVGASGEVSNALEHLDMYPMTAFKGDGGRWD